MQIHHLEIARSEHYVVDPELGVVRRKEQTVRQSSTTKIGHEGKEYDVASDGSFDVPDEVGRFFLRLPNWHSGPSPFATDPRDTDVTPANPPAPVRRTKAATRA